LIAGLEQKSGTIKKRFGFQTARRLNEAEMNLHYSVEQKIERRKDMISQQKIESYVFKLIGQC